MHLEIFDIKLQAATCDQYKNKGYIILEDYNYKDGSVDIWIPRSFYYDGASIPSLLWFLLYNPFDPVVMEAALIHDWLYSTKVVNRSIADRILKTKLKDDGADWLRRNLIWLGVRSFGWLFGWPDTKDDIDYMKGLYTELVTRNITPDKYQFPKEFKINISLPPKPSRDIKKNQRKNLSQNPKPTKEAPDNTRPDI
jgi:hypothetical protein